MLVGSHEQQLVDQNQEIRAIIDEFKEVFGEAIGLPPKRTFLHQILLKEGTTPISIRLYIYPHYQKTKIENIVKDLLISSVVRPSQSSFSSLVLLIKKYDGFWKMCVNYCALNQ